MPTISEVSDCSDYSSTQQEDYECLSKLFLSEGFFLQGVPVDLASLVGLVGAFGIVVMAMILGGDLGMFLNIPSVLIVVVGSIFAVMMKFELGQFLGAVKVAAKAFSFKMSKPETIIEEVVELAGLARKGGLLSLEGKEVSDDFLGKGIQLLVDGHDPDVVRTLMSKELKQASERHTIGIDIFKAIGDVAPAMGMIGTLIGLVAMLANMDDPKTIGPAMAVALLTTLYGAMMATMFALPVGDKLTLRKDEEDRLKSMIIDALLAIQSGQNPRVIETMLQAYIQEGKRTTSGD
jgi:chemotaxis protein MotA